MSSSFIMNASLLYLLSAVGHSPRIYWSREDAFEDLADAQGEYPDVTWHLFKTEVHWTSAVDTQLTLW